MALRVKMASQHLSECMAVAKENGHTQLHDLLMKHKDLIDHCVNGNVSGVENILESQEISREFCSGSPLYEACQNGHVEVVDRLLAYGADPNFFYGQNIEHEHSGGQ